MADPAIAFVHRHTVDRVSVSDLAVMNADGSHQTLLWRDINSEGGLLAPAMSPDLDRDPSNGYQGSIVVIRGAQWDSRDFDLWIVDVQVNADGVTRGIPRLLAKNAIDPSWSPRGDLIAYAAAHPSFDGVAVVSPDGTTVPPTLVFPIPDPSTEGVNYTTWSPDGMRVAFGYFGEGSSQIRLWVKQVVDSTTGELIISRDAREIIPKGVLGSSMRDPQWSRAGSVVAFVIGSKTDDIYTIDVDATVPLNTLRAVVGTRDAESPTWSPDDPNTPQDETDRFLVFGTIGPKQRIMRLELASAVKTVIAETRSGGFRWPDWRPFPTTFVSLSSTSTAALPSLSRVTTAIDPSKIDLTADFTATTNSQVTVRLLSPEPAASSPDTPEEFRIGQRIVVHGVFNGAPMPDGANVIIDLIAQSLDGLILFEVHTEVPIDGNQFQYSFKTPDQPARIRMRIVFRAPATDLALVFRRFISVEYVVEDLMTGSEGQDWFFANLDNGILDKITDLHADEFAEDLVAP